MPAPFVRTIVFLVVVGAIVLAACGSGTSGGAAGEAGESANISTFSKSYGGPLHDEASVVLNTADGGFMLFGSAEGEDLGALVGGDFWLQKLDANGNVEHNRTLGLRSPAPLGTTWTRARPTPDGGAVLIGTHDQTQVLTRPQGATATLVVSRDIAIAKLDAAGNTVWSVTHDSGAWQNYAYFQRETDLPAARDVGRDVWPMEDGGFLVAATSTANLEDTFDLGFPCDDEELNEFGRREQGHVQCEGGGPEASFRFIGAYSVVVFRVNADGSLRWTRRLTDNPYDKSNSRFDIGVIVRGTADGGAVLARAVGRGSAVVRRLGADGSSRWRTAIYAALPAQSTFAGSSLPRDLLQTDDPVDGHDGDLYDGQRDDGFALAGIERVIQLDADGAVRWNEAVSLEGAVSNPEISVQALTQHCDYGRPTRCDLLAVGAFQTQALPLVDPDLAADDAFVAFLDEDGDLRAQLSSPRDAMGTQVFKSYRRIVAAGGGRFELLGATDDGLGVVTIEATPAARTWQNPRRIDGVSGSDAGELRGAGGLVVLTAGAGSVQYRDAQGALQATANVAAGVPSSEVLRAAVQIGAGRYLLAGTRRAPGGQSGLVALRYDLNASGAQVVWQRRLAGDETGLADVTAAVASADGGAVLALSFPNGEASTLGQLLKLDANGNRVWHSALPGRARELQRMPDGGFAALTYSLGDEQLRVTRISAAGTWLWQNSVSLGEAQGQVQTMAAMTDGGLVLAGSFASRISLVHLASDGRLVAGNDVILPNPRGRKINFDDLRIRQAAGGFVLAMTESGIFSSDAAESLPLGQSNVLVLEVDAAFQPLWAHVYGARFDEGVRDLTVGEDGTIAVAGYSDSLGERREAWLLKLSPHGLISSAGCQALLGTIAPEQLGSAARTASVMPSDTNLPELAELPPFTDTDALPYTPADFVTARQCLGDASAGREPPPPPALQRLTVLQVGTKRGVVTSTPTGISCGTGLDICSAAFAPGSRVSLRADIDEFVAWRGDCDEGTGGTSLECVIRLDRNRTMQVEFGAPLPPPPPPPPPPGPTFTLEFTVLGRGYVSTDGGITCNERDSVQTCSRSLPAGTLVNATAFPDSGLSLLGWSGGTNGDPLCLSFGRERTVQFTLDRDLRCQVQFGSGDARPMLTLEVSGQGEVRYLGNSFSLQCREYAPLNECRGFLDSGTFVQLIPAAFEGWRFAGWGEDCASSNAAPLHQFTILRDTFCTATFVHAIVTLTVVVENATGGRNVSSQPLGIECSSDGTQDCTEGFEFGSIVTLRASPQGLLSLAGCNRVFDGNFCEITMTQSRTVTARFSP